MNATVAAAAEPTAARGWLHSPRFDLLFLNGSIVMLFLPFLLHGKLFPGVGWVWFVVAANLLVDYPHHMSTWTRVYAEREFARRLPGLRWALPAAIFTFCIWGWTTERGIIVGATLFAFMIVHGASQLAHLAWQYRRLDPGADRWSALSETALIVAAPFAMYGAGLRAAVSGPYGDAELLRFFDLFFHPAVVSLAWAVFWASAVGVLALHADRLAKGRPVHPQRLLFLGVAVAAYAIVGYGIPAWAPAGKNLLPYIVEGYVWYHSVQYISFTWLVNRRKADRRELQNGVLARLARPGGGARYYATIIVPQFVAVALLVLLLNAALPLRGGSGGGLDGMMGGWYVPIDWALALTHFSLDQFFFTGAVFYGLHPRARRAGAALPGRASAGA